MTLHIKKAYDPSIPCRISFHQPSLTKQSFKDETDINNILKNYNKTGLINTNNETPQYLDASMNMDFHQATNALITIQDNFDNLPAKIRKKFHNDPAEYLNFCSDPDNIEELRALGLAEPLEVPPPTQTNTQTNTPPPDEKSTPQPPSGKV